MPGAAGGQGDRGNENASAFPQAEAFPIGGVMILLRLGEMMRILSGALWVMALIGLTGCDDSPSHARDNDVAAGGRAGAQMILTHQAHFREMEGRSEAVDRALAGRAPPLAVIRENAQQLADDAPQILTWFPAGSGAEAGIATGATAEIWRDQEGFGRAAADFIAAAEEFNIAARHGDLAALRVARPALAEACTGCHRRFRAAGGVE